MFPFFDARPDQHREETTPLQLACDANDAPAVRAAAADASADELHAALYRACQRQSFSAVEALLALPAVDVNAASNGSTALDSAATQGNPEIIQLLLRHGADVHGHATSQANEETTTTDSPLLKLFRVASKRSLARPDALERFRQAMILLVEAGCDINATDTQGRTVLHTCLAKGIPLADVLLEYGADPTRTDRMGLAPMHLFDPSLQNAKACLAALIAHGAALDARAEDGATPLHRLASLGQLGDLSLFDPFVSDWGMVDGKGNTLLHRASATHQPGNATLGELLKRGLDPTKENRQGRQPVHLVDGLREAVEDALDILCAAGASLEAKDAQGKTRLSLGVTQFNASGLLECLVERGANINTQDYQGNGILHGLVAPHKFDADQLDLLLSLGADPMLANYDGDTFLHRLAANLATITDEKALTTMVQLLESGAIADRRNRKGQTPLHLLCSRGSEHLFAGAVEGSKMAIDLVLDAGLSTTINIADDHGIRPIHLAATVSELLVDVLVRRGASTMVTTAEGRNLLHIAALARQTNVVGYLLDHYTMTGNLSMVNAKSKDGRTSLHLACRSGRLETVTLLLEHGADVDIEDEKKHTPLQACATFLAEDQLWQGSPDEENLFNNPSAAGILIEDRQRPHQPESRPKRQDDQRQYPRRIGWEGEITTEEYTLGIKRIVRALVSHGAALVPKNFGSDPVFSAVHAGCDEMVEEMDRLAREKGTQLAKRYSLETECCLLRSRQLPALLQERFAGYLDEHSVISMLLMGYQDEVAQAIEANATTLAGNGNIPEILVTLARWGYHELFSRIGHILPAHTGWINGSGLDKLRQKLVPSLLAAGQRELPNLDTIKVIVEQFHADVNIQFEQGTAVKPKVYYQSQVAHNRQYQPGDTILHQLAQGGHWWHEGAIKYLLAHGADPNMRNRSGKTPLCYAVQRSDLGIYRQREITRILLEGGADPNIAAHCGYTPLAMATHDSHLFQLLVDYGARPSTTHPMELFSAVSNFNHDAVQSLLTMGLHCNTTALSDEQPHWHTHRVAKLPPTKDTILYPLHYVSLPPFNERHSREHAVRMVHRLLGHGADPFLQCEGPSLILHDIFSSGGVIQPWLEMSTLDLERRDGRGQTLLLAAATCPIGVRSYAFTAPMLPYRGGRLLPTLWMEGDTTRAMALYKRGADLNSLDNKGNNVIHILASVNPHGEIAETAFSNTMSVFLEKVPQLAHQVNKDGETPLQVAEKGGRTWAVDILQRYSTASLSAGGASE